MNISDLVNFFETLGIKMLVKDNKIVAFVDEESYELMNSYYNIEECGIECDISRAIYLRDNINISSSRIDATINLGRPIVDKKILGNDVILDKFKYTNKNSKKTYNMSFVSGKDPFIRIESTDCDKNECNTIIYANGDILLGMYDYTLEKEENVSFKKGEYTDGNVKEALKEIFESDELFTKAINYYSILFPNMRGSLDKAMNVKTK